MRRRLTRHERHRERQVFLPYGVWTCADRLVLFNREYQSIWERRRDGAAHLCVRRKDIQGVLSTTWFYDDWAVHRESRLNERLRTILTAFLNHQEMAA